MHSQKKSKKVCDGGSQPDSKMVIYIRIFETPKQIHNLRVMEVMFNQMNGEKFVS